MSGKYDGYQAKIDCLKQLGTRVYCGVLSSAVFKNAFYSLKESCNFHIDSGELICLNLRGGVSECERIVISLSNEMVVVGFSYLIVS